MQQAQGCALRGSECGVDPDHWFGCQTRSQVQSQAVIAMRDEMDPEE